MLDMIPLVMLAGATAGGGGHAVSIPLTLQVRTDAGVKVIEVVGESAVACSATYRLEVTDGLGRNRSVTAGSAQMIGGARQIIATVKLNSNAAASTVASLEVKPCNGPPYKQSWPN